MSDASETVNADVSDSALPVDDSKVTTAAEMSPVEADGGAQSLDGLASASSTAAGAAVPNVPVTVTVEPSVCDLSRRLLVTRANEVGLCGQSDE